MSEQNCGTCGWWYGHEGVRMVSKCDAPVPDSVVGVITKDTTYVSDGTTCPCWKERE
jgi:hypothetical protein